MAIVTSTSATISNMLAYETNITPSRDASFSSYLNTGEETFVLKLAESIEKPVTTITTLQEPLYQASLGRKKMDCEIGVFGAEKYFNGKMDEDEETKIRENVGMKPYDKRDERLVIHHLKPQMKPGTPSSCSEASWNSRSALLTGALRNPSPNRQYKANGKSLLAALGCSCSDKKSVDIEEKKKKNINYESVHGKMIVKVPSNVKQATMTPQSWLTEKSPCNNIDNFSFPNANSGTRNLTVETQFEGEKQEMARKSIEVFGSPVMEKENIALSLEKRLNMLTWDANPRAEGIPRVPSIAGEIKINDIRVEAIPVVPIVAGGMKIEDTGNESDSSSDLFEIKSLSNNKNPFLTRQGSDGMSTCMSPSTCYEPSEASIDWSVVTASAANFSVASDYDDQRSITSCRNHRLLITAADNTGTKTKGQLNKEVPKRRAGILSGCKSQKAVNIVQAHKMPQKKSEQIRPHRSGSVTPMSRFQAETKVMDVESAHAQHAFTTQSLSQLHSLRASNTLYMD